MRIVKRRLRSSDKRYLLLLLTNILVGLLVGVLLFYIFPKVMMALLDMYSRASASSVAQNRGQRYIFVPTSSFPAMGLVFLGFIIMVKIPYLSAAFLALGMDPSVDILKDDKGLREYLVIAMAYLGAFGGIYIAMNLW